ALVFFILKKLSKLKGFLLVESLLVFFESLFPFVDPNFPDLPNFFKTELLSFFVIKKRVPKQIIKAGYEIVVSSYFSLKNLDKIL
ncbi:MAG: hypothetical protein ACK56F_22955, partial [bacterium]